LLNFANLVVVFTKLPKIAISHSKAANTSLTSDGGQPNFPHFRQKITATVFNTNDYHFEEG